MDIIPVLAKASGDVPGWLFLFVIAPYFFLIHLGMATWVVCILKKLVKLDFSLKVTKTKLIAALYGGIVGFSLSFMTNIYHGYDAPPLSVYGNMMALIFAGPYHFNSVMFFVPYVVLGLLGGWGLGQFIQWTSGLLKRAISQHQ